MSLTNGDQVSTTEANTDIAETIFVDKSAQENVDGISSFDVMSREERSQSRRRRNRRNAPGFASAFLLGLKL